MYIYIYIYIYIYGHSHTKKSIPSSTSPTQHPTPNHTRPHRHMADESYPAASPPDSSTGEAYDPSAQPFLPSAASGEEEKERRDENGRGGGGGVSVSSATKDDPETRHLCKRLYVGRLNSSVKDDDLFDLFGKYGKIRYAKVRLCGV